MNHDGSLFVIRGSVARDQRLEGTHIVRLPFGVYYRNAPILVKSIEVHGKTEVCRPHTVLARVYGWDCGKDGSPDNTELQAELRHHDTTTHHATGARTHVGGSYRWRAAFPGDYAVTPDLHLLDESILHLRALHHLGRCGITSHAHDSDDSMQHCVREQIVRHQSGLVPIPELESLMELAPTWSGSVYIPGTCATPIGHAVSYLPMRWWTTNTYATEGLLEVNGDRSGCMKNVEPGEVDVCHHPPFAALHRIYASRHPKLMSARSLKRRAEDGRSGLPREYVSVSLSYLDAKPNFFSVIDGVQLLQPVVAHWDATHFFDGNALENIQIPAISPTPVVVEITDVSDDPHPTVTARVVPKKPEAPKPAEALLEEWIHQKLGACTERKHDNCLRNFTEARRCLRAAKGWS